MGIKVYLLDTNVISEPTKVSPLESVLSQLEYKSEFSVIASPTWYELIKGCELLPDGKKKEQIRSFLYDYVATSFDIIPYDSHAASVHADIFCRMKENGTPVPYTDSQLAAIAISNNLILSTRNIKDFAPIQASFSLGLENWFEK